MGSKEIRAAAQAGRETVERFERNFKLLNALEEIVLSKEEAMLRRLIPDHTFAVLGEWYSANSEALAEVRTVRFLGSIREQVVLHPPFTPDHLSAADLAAQELIADLDTRLSEIEVE